MKHESIFSQGKIVINLISAEFVQKYVVMLKIALFHFISRSGNQFKHKNQSLFSFCSEASSCEKYCIICRVKRKKDF